MHHMRFKFFVLLHVLLFSLFLIPPNVAQWTTTSLSLASDELAATSVSGLALFAGGFNHSGIGISVVDIYNSSTRMWTTASPRPRPS
jgi:hypothetical protein